MKKISRRTSVQLSIIAAAVALVMMTAILFILPSLTGWLFELFNKNDEMYSATLYYLYLLTIPGFAADICLLGLLKNIRAEKIFTDGSIRLLRIISWSCICEGVLMLAFGYHYATSALLGFAALFMGLIIRVIKNVIEEATAIKNENDYTI